MAQRLESLEQLGTLLRQLRRATGKPLRVVAELAGINPGTLLKWEQGAHWPQVNKLDQLLRWYGETVSIGWPDATGKGEK